MIGRTILSPTIEGVFFVCLQVSFYPCFISCVPPAIFRARQRRPEMTKYLRIQFATGCSFLFSSSSLKRKKTCDCYFLQLFGLPLFIGYFSMFTVLIIYTHYCIIVTVNTVHLRYIKSLEAKRFGCVGIGTCIAAVSPKSLSFI